MTPEPALLTAREVAEALRVDTATVQRWARTEQIGCVRLPSGRLRFPRAEVQRLLDGEPVPQQ
jgi:excisionase family DNA binding protein